MMNTLCSHKNTIELCGVLGKILARYNSSGSWNRRVPLDPLMRMRWSLSGCALSSAFTASTSEKVRKRAAWSTESVLRA